MKYFSRVNRHLQDGFTLVEIIISLVISGVLAAMIATYINNSSIARGVTPASNLRDTLNIYTVMEHMRLEYNNNPTRDLASLKTLVGPVGSPPIYGGKPQFGSITYDVLYNGYVKCDASTTTTFVFEADSSCPTNPPCTLLVSISDPEQPGITASNLFTQ